MTLQEIVSTFVYRPGWRLWLDVIGGQLTLNVFTTGFDSYHPERGLTYHTHHYFKVPEQHGTCCWRQWLFDRLGDVEIHERMEFFQVAGERPYNPLHSRSAGTYYTVRCPHDHDHTDVHPHGRPPDS